MAFENEAFSVYRLKSYFICNFWSWSNAHSGDRDRTLLDFLTWMGYSWFFIGLVGSFAPLASFFGLSFLCILSVYFRAALVVFFLCLIHFVCLPIKKKKKKKIC